MQFVAATLAAWGVFIYGGFKIFGGEKKAEVLLTLSLIVRLELHQ